MKKITVLFLVFLVFVLAAPAAARGKPPNEDPPDEISVLAGTAVIDGDPGEWAGQVCDVPLHWAGKANKEILSVVCLRYSAESETLFFYGKPTGDHEINFKPDSVHVTFDKEKLWVDGEEIPVDIYINDGGFPAGAGFEAAAHVAPGNYAAVIHISIFPDGIWETSEGSGESSRTLKGLYISVE